MMKERVITYKQYDLDYFFSMIIRLFIALGLFLALLIYGLVVIL